MGVCDVPVISTVCDIAGEAAATVVAARSTGSHRRWAARPVG